MVFVAGHLPLLDTVTVIVPVPVEFQVTLTLFPFAGPLIVPLVTVHAYEAPVTAGTEYVAVKLPQ
jgi:hypothetical protein